MTDYQPRLTIRIMGLTSGKPIPEYEGKFVVSYDPEVHLPDRSYDGGELIVTPDRQRATRYTHAEFHDLWSSGPTCECHYFLPTGERARPLSGFNVELEPVV
jgi:hypothetical protein